MNRYDVRVLALQQPSKLIMATCMLMLSMLLAAYGPMASISGAQSAIDASKLQDLKQRAISELDRRINNFQKTLDSMKIDVTASISKDGASAKVETNRGSAEASMDKNGAKVSTENQNGGSSSFSIGKDGLNATVSFPGTIKEKAKQFLQKIIEELKQLKEKVKSATSLDKMKSLAQNIDSQLGLNQLGQVQSAVTQAIQSLTGVFGKIKETAKNLQGQITKMKDCLKSGNAKVDVNGSASSAGGASGSASLNGEGCEGLNLDSDDIAKQAQSQLDNISTIMATIASVLSSAVALLTTLVASFSSVVGSLGSLGSLGNIGNLSNLSSLGDLSSLAGSAGSISGLLTSFTGLASQLDVANGMAGNVQGALGPLASLINL